MTEEYNSTRGDITIQHTIWCGICSTWEQAMARTRASMARIARQAGWKNTRKHGWLCPACSKSLQAGTGVHPPHSSHKVNIEHMEALRDRSGHITSVSPLVSFLYELMRDHVPVGVVEHIMTNTSTQPCTFSNGWLASYATDVAKRLTGDQPVDAEHNDPLLGPLVVQKYILQMAKREAKASDIPQEYRGIVLAMGEQDLIAIPKLVVEIEKVASEVTFRAVYEGSVLATYKTWDNVIMAGGNPRALLSLFMKDVCQTLWTSFNIYALEEQVWNKVAEAVDRMAKAAHYPDGEELNR